MSDVVVIKVVGLVKGAEEGVELLLRFLLFSGCWSGEGQRIEGMDGTWADFVILVKGEEEGVADVVVIKVFGLVMGAEV